MTPTDLYDRVVPPWESSLHPAVRHLFAELDEVGKRPWMWVDHWAEQVPDAVAISDSDETWTWRHLRREVHRWSARVGAAAAPGGVVALSARKRPAVVAAMIGVMRAGNVVLVVDTDESPERLAAVLSDVQPSLRFGDPGAFPGVDPVTVRSFDFDGPGGPDVVAAEPGELDAAWITFTSGSTGVPKGMTTTHGMLTQRAAEGRRFVIISERPVVSGFHEFTFMGVVKSVFGGLAAGAHVRLFRPRLESVPSILSTIQEQRLTVLHGPPQLMRPLWSSCEPDDPRLATVRRVRFGADRTQPADLRAALRCLPDGCEVVIAYGSGELGSIAEVQYRRGDTIPTGRLPVGYPEAWVEVTPVDDDGAPVPRGEVGVVEIRSHGYTALPFPPPADGVPPATLRNGDTARILDGGSLDLVGRADARVKIDGVGVDLNEVDAVLQSHPAVDQAVCILAERSDRRAEIVAVVLASKPIEGRELRETCRSLPPASRPTSFRFVDAFPTNRRNKVDRNVVEALVAAGG